VAVAATAGGATACALERAGTVRCWDMHASPFDWGLPIRTITDATQISIGGVTGCVVRRSGRLWCWGENSAGLVGVPPVAERVGPVAVPGLDGVVQAGVGSLACALLRDGRVLCWGPPYGHDPQRVL
jgi:hypothetical protein